jgi:ABC-2 type transport system ATP-binding protein
MTAPALEFLSVSKWYGQVSALTDVTLALNPGVTGLVGRNGAGKSTLIKLACGLLRPSQGLVQLHGKPPAHAAARAGLGLCPDVERLYEGSTGLQFVAWMLRLQGASARGARARAAEVLAELGLGDAMHRRIKTYSKGMRQRVKLAQAVAHEPGIVLLDEPLTGLDPVARVEFGDRIRALGEQGRTVLVSSHVLHELQSVARTFVVIDRGRVLAEGPLAELREQLADRPRRLQLASRRPRELATRLARLDDVAGVRVTADGVTVEARGGTALGAQLTALGAEADGLIDELWPLDDDLESVFGYLVS